MLHTAASITVPKLVMHIQTGVRKYVLQKTGYVLTLTYRILQDIGLSQYTLPVSGLQYALPTLLTYNTTCF
jgi:hypothetical protein